MINYSNLTVVMYHYIRDTGGTEFPGLKALSVKDFKEQIAYLKKHHNFAKATSVIRREPLPPNPVLLTFDDGYIDVYDNALPIIRSEMLESSCIVFPVVNSSHDDCLLDINKIHLILSKSDELSIVSELDNYIINNHIRHRLLSPKEYKEIEYKHPFDSKTVCYIKNLLQKSLPEPARHEILNILFDKFVGICPKQISETLYLKEKHLLEMLESKMLIGGHGKTHCWLEDYERKIQEIEIESSIEFLLSLGVPTFDLTFSYPYGSYNSLTLQILKEKRIGAAFATSLKSPCADGGKLSLLEIPRVDVMAVNVKNGS